MNIFGENDETEPMKELSKNKYDVYSRCKLLFIGLPYLKKNNISVDAKLAEIANKVSIHIFSIEKKSYNRLSHKLRLDEIYNDNAVLIEDMISILDKQLDEGDSMAYKPMEIKAQLPVLDPQTALDKEEIVDDIEIKGEDGI